MHKTVKSAVATLFLISGLLAGCTGDPLPNAHKDYAERLERVLATPIAQPHYLSFRTQQAFVNRRRLLQSNSVSFTRLKTAKLPVKWLRETQPWEKRSYRHNVSATN